MASRPTKLEIAERNAKVARLRFETRADEIRLKALAGSFPNARRSRTRVGSRPLSGSGQAHRDKASREALRRECQLLYRHNPIAQSLIDTQAELVIGDGPQLSVLTKDEAFNLEAQQRFAAWAQTADLTGLATLEDVLGQVLTAWHTDGRVMLLKVRGGQEQNGGRLQVIEDERIINPSGTQDTETLIAGVELGPTGGIARVHVADWGPTGTYIKPDPRPIAAGLFFYEPNPLVRVPGVLAPEATLQSVINELELIDDSVEATAIAYRIATFFGAIQYSEDPQAEQAALIQGLGTNDYNSGAGSGDPSEMELQAGMLWHLKTGGKVEQIKPEHPVTHLDRYVWLVVQLVGARIGMPIDLSHFVNDASFSATRSRLAIGWRRLATVRRRMRRLLTGISRWKVAEWIASGELPEVEGWDRHEWKMAPMPMLDPAVEIKTRREAIDAMLMDYQTASDELGLGDWKATVRTRADQEQLLRANGLEVVRVGAAAPSGGGGTGGTAPGDTGTDGQPLNTGT